MRCISRLLVVVTGVLLIATAGEAMGQTNLGPDITSATSPLPPAQIDRIRSYIRELVGTVDPASPDIQALVAARKSLLEPIRRPGVAPIFQTTYSAILADQIIAWMTSDSQVVRLNATVIVGSLTGGAGVDLIAQALRDDVPSIRYRAAKAVVDATMTTAEVYDPRQQQQLGQGLLAAMQTEESVPVLGVIYRALGSLTLEEPRAKLVERLTARVGEQVKKLEVDRLIAELEGLNRYNSRMWSLVISGERSKSDLKSSALLSAHYLQLIARAVQQDRVSNLQFPAIAEAVRIIEQNLNFVVSEYDEAFTTGPKLHEPLVQNRNGEFQLNVIEWVGTVERPGLLNTQKINLSQAKLPLAS